jgi:glycosyltransferase involved in cell wall biosynthesis
MTTVSEDSEVAGGLSMREGRAPRVSIGLPVYNGEKFLRATLDSILAQSFTDFEVVICDNCSTDSTPEICREYQARDSRVAYHRNERNLGPAPNYNRCFDLSRGDLFKWSAADDLMAPAFLERCVEALDKDASLAGVFPAAKEIDESGRDLFDHDTEIDLSARSRPVRLWQYIFTDHRKNHATELWGVFRANVLRTWRPLKGSYPSADRVVVARAALNGPLPRLKERLFLNRSHGNRSQTYLDRSKVRPGSVLVKWLGCGPLPAYEWWDASKKGKIVFPEWRWWGEYVRAVYTTKMPFPSKLACLAVTACLFVKFIPRLGRDLIIAAELMIYHLLGTRPKPPSSRHDSQIQSARPARSH